MKRAFILLLDSFGIGELEDAAKFGDKGANTLMHIKEFCDTGKADKVGVRQGPLHIPNLTNLGLFAAANKDSDFNKAEGLYGSARELSFGKDTSSGHWEIMGVPVLFDWGYFPPEYPSFPKELVDGLIKQAKIPGILGNCHASGTEIINRLGDEHLKTGMPICYTSADSVFQIAAHEESFGLERLYEVCKVAYELVKPYKIGRIIARPFSGKNGDYQRTKNRRDFSIPPPAPTLMEKMVAAGKEVIAIGKISDIFAGRGVSKSIAAYGHDEIFNAVLNSVKESRDGSLAFANFIDFDMKYGHRRDFIGYAHALEDFDRKLPELDQYLQPGDLVIITADHGCDPTFKGSDHTREHIPVLVFGPGVAPKYIGVRKTFADIGQTLASHFSLVPLPYGESFL